MEIGQTVAGRYRLLDRLGSGGMSVVWRAKDQVLGREVAVKVLGATDPDLLSDLYAEARSAAGLRHPHVVEVYDYGETDGQPYVVMELVAGRPLNALLAAGPLPWRPAVLIAAQVAAALAAAHERGVVHRDVKPANVMVDATEVKLVDFGISAAAGEPDGDEGHVLGTPAYLAPERLAGGVVRPETDVYALGLLIYLMVAGGLPWQASTTTQMLHAHQYEEPAPLPAVPDLPEEVARLCRQCLAKRPEDRPSAAAAARILGAAARTAPLSATVPIPLQRRRGLVGAMAAVAVVLLLVAGATWLFTRPSGTAPPAVADAIRCTVRYAVQDVADGRTSTAVTLVNDGRTALGSWHLDFRLPTGQQLIRGSNATWQQTGANVRAAGSALPPGRPLTTTFEASYRTATTLPGTFTLNGVTCRSDLSLQGRTTAPATTAPAVQANADDNRGRGKGDDGGGGGKGKGKG